MEVSLYQDFIEGRKKRIAAVKKEHPEQSILLHDIIGDDGINEVGILSERMGWHWMKGLNIEQAVAIVVKYGKITKERI